MFKRTNTVDVFDQIVDQCRDSDGDVGGPPSDDAGEPEPDCSADEQPSGSDSEPSEGAGAEDTPRSKPDSRRRRYRLAAVAVAVLSFVAALSIIGWQQWRLAQDAATAAAGSAALDTARRYVVALTSVDSKDIDKNFAQVLDGATGEFKDMYSQSSAQLRQLLVDNKAVSRGTVVDSAIKSASTNRVQVLMFVDQSISNAVTPQPRIDRVRIAVTMELVDKHWLASHVEVS